MDLDKKIISRNTYSILDCLSDIGGLIYLLYIVGSIILSSITSFYLDTTILYQVFDEKRECSDAKNNVDDLSRIKVDFSSFQENEMRSSLRDYCCPQPTFKRKLAKSKIAINKELNLHKMIHR